MKELSPSIPDSPGFVDVHAHFTGRDGLEDLLPAGVVAVRNAGMHQNSRLKNPPPGPGSPVAITSGWALYKAGGYGGRFGVPLETKTQIKAEILKLKDAGADIIKVMASGILSVKHPGTVTPGGFDPGELRFIVNEAAELGLEVMAHANTEPAITAAVEAGVRSVEHGFFMTRRSLELMAMKNIYWVPTIGALERAAARNGGGALKFVSETIDAHLGMLRQAYSIGVPLAIGTDCVLPDGGYKKAYQAEIAFFLKAGIPAREIMKIAREGGARLLGIEQQLIHRK